MIAIILTVLGLCLFETISSIDNAIINAEVLGTVSAKARRWFLVWGILIAVFLVRGLLPWLIVWAATPSLGPIEAFMATMSNDPQVVNAIESSAPSLLVGGGIFLVLLFLHWLFLEPKAYGLPIERFISRQGVWFYTVASLFLALVVWYSSKIGPSAAFSAVIGSTAFFITHGFKEQAASIESDLTNNQKGLSDVSKILYLEVIDATFSIDGVLGAFAFTLSVPLILLGNGLGTIIVRQLTMGNIENIKKYKYLKNGAMYSVFALGIIMISEAFGLHVPEYLSPIITFGIVGYFMWKSVKHNKQTAIQ